MHLEHTTLHGLATYYTPPQPGQPRICWLHGYSLNASLWPAIWQYFPEAMHLAVDLPSHGDSVAVNAFRDLDDLADKLVAIARQFDCDHIAGFSFGGILGLQMIIRAPQLFKSLSLVSSPVGGALIDTDAQLHNQALIRLYQEKGAGPWLTEHWIKSPPDIFTGLKKQPAQFNRILPLIAQHRWGELADNGFAAFTATRQLVPALKNNRARLFGYIGEDDMPYIKRCNELLFRHVPGGSRYYLPDCGHLPLLEMPEQVMALIKDNLLAL